MTERATELYVAESTDLATHLAELSFLHSAETRYTLNIDMYIYEGLCKSIERERNWHVMC